MKELVNKVSAILYEQDPVKLHSPKEDEYVHEAKLICERLKPETPLEDVHTIVYDVFCSQFNYAEGEDGSAKFIMNVAGSKDKYFETAALIFAEKNDAK